MFTLEVVWQQRLWVSGDFGRTKGNEVVRQIDGLSEQLQVWRVLAGYRRTSASAESLDPVSPRPQAGVAVEQQTSSSTSLCSPTFAAAAATCAAVSGLRRVRSPTAASTQT
jgi:hypothetical protein